MKTICTWLGLAACFCVCTLASATPVTWTLSDIALGDGGTASGSFVYDASTDTFTDIDITTTAGSERGGASYDFPSSVGNASIADFISNALPIDAGTTSRFEISLDKPMTDAGGTINVSAAYEFTCVVTDCSFTSTTEAGLDLRAAFGGDITTSTVPEPASLALVGIALAAAALRRRVQ